MKKKSVSESSTGIFFLCFHSGHFANMKTLCSLGPCIFNLLTITSLKKFCEILLQYFSVLLIVFPPWTALVREEGTLQRLLPCLSPLFSGLYVPPYKSDFCWLASHRWLLGANIVYTVELSESDSAMAVVVINLLGHRAQTFHQFWVMVLSLEISISTGRFGVNSFLSCGGSHPISWRLLCIRVCLYVCGDLCAFICQCTREHVDSRLMLNVFLDCYPLPSMMFFEIGSVTEARGQKWRKMWGDWCFLWGL